MQIVTDSGTDLYLPPEQKNGLDIHIVPLSVTLEKKSFREGVDIQTGEFYRMLAATDSLPLTSQPVPVPSWCQRQTLLSLTPRHCRPRRGGRWRRRPERRRPVGRRSKYWR